MPRPSSTHAGQPVFLDLPARSCAVIERVRGVLQAGRIPLPETTRTALARELDDIQRALAGTTTQASCECTSIFPAAWLQARWQSLFEGAGNWYPHLAEQTTAATPLMISGALVIRYAHASRLSLWSELGPEVHFTGALFDGFAKSAMETAEQCPQPDPLLVFWPVREVRAAIIARILASAGKGNNLKFSGDQVPALQRDLAPKLIAMGDRLKVNTTVRFEPRAGGATIAIEAANGVDRGSVVQLVHVQRLAVLLLGLIHGNRLGNLNYQTLSHLDTEEQLRERGLSDLDRREGTESQWDRLLSAITAEMARRKTVPVMDTTNTNLKGWLDHGKLMGMTKSQTVVLVARRMLRSDMPDFLRCLTRLSPKLPKKLLLIVGSLDGPVVRDIASMIQKDPWLFEYAAIDPGVCACEHRPRNSEEWTRSADYPFEATKKLLKSLKQPLELTTYEDLFMGLVPRMGITDPMLSLYWLGLRHIACAKLGMAFDDI